MGRVANQGVSSEPRKRVRPRSGVADVDGRRAMGVGGWVMLGTLLAWVGAFVVAPAVIMLVYSFCQRDELGEIVYAFTWENYRRAFGSVVYARVLWRSVVYAGVTTGLCLVVGYPVAFVIARAAGRWRDRLLVLVMIPFWTSFLIRTYAWVTILRHEGLLNQVLGLLGFGSVDLLYTPWAVVIGLVYAYLPFMILPVFGSIEKLDASLIEAGMDLGGSPLRVFWRVVWPLSLPGVWAGVLLVFVPAIGMFAVTDLLGGAKVPLVGDVIQNQFGQARDWPFGAALGTVLLGMFVVGYGVCWKRAEA